MHIIFSVLGAAGAFAYYWYILRDAGDIVENVANAAGRARGNYRRNQFRKKAEASTIQAINDPRIAAIVMAVAIAGNNGELSGAQDDVLAGAMTDILRVDDPVSELVFAKWAVQSSGEPKSIIKQLRNLWLTTLTAEERRQFVDLVYRVASADGDVSAQQIRSIDYLRSALGIVD